MAYKVVCLDERAAQPEYDVVLESDKFHSPVATFHSENRAKYYARMLNILAVSDVCVMTRETTQE